MPYAFHSDPAQKWNQQYLTTKHHILPFIQEHHNLSSGSKVLEIGCGEGGVLKAFSEAGYTCYGIDISTSRIENGKKLLEEEVRKKSITLYTGDVHDITPLEHLTGELDLVILKDAIEHIPDQEKVLNLLHRFVKSGGAVFLAFPPWLNPFGGHQQLARSVLKCIPWFHVLPRTAYRGILRLFRESDDKIRGLMEIYDTRLSTARFEAILSRSNWRVGKRQFFLFNPAYEFKFGIRPRKQFAIISAIPLLRDFVSTAVYYIIDTAS